MRQSLFLCSLTLLAALISGCSVWGGKNPFASDPLTGGVNASTSNILGVALPPGLQRFSSHGRIDHNGEGLETLRGAINSTSAALELFNTLKDSGWQLRLALRENARAVYLYQKDEEYAIIAFHPQGMLTILEIWKGAALPDGSMLSWKNRSESGYNSLPGEEYRPAGRKKDISVETWGD